MKLKRKTYSVEEAYRLMEHYCAYRERSYKEVEERMKHLAFIPQLREEILLHLIENGYLNEERYARAFARGKFYIKRWGRNKIRNLLRLNGVSDRNIELGLAEINEDDYRRTLENLIERKLQSLHRLTPVDRKRRLVRYLQQKGYELAIIFELMEQKMEKD